MAAPVVTLPRPTIDHVNACIQRFDREQHVVEAALTKLFSLYPENSQLENVLLKVVALNSLYVTGILATYQMAEHIHKLNCELNIDQMIREGQSDAVVKIALLRIGDKTRNNYSFATKYCSWHNSEDYPVYDSYVEKLLWGYRKQNKQNKERFVDYSRYETRDYKRFREIVFSFRECYGLSHYSLKDLDKFLWLAGKEYFPPTWDNASN